MTAAGVPADVSSAPRRAKLVLLALILVAAVANLNLSVANVALPSIDRAFESSQTMLDLIAVGYSLGLAATVLYLGAVGDRYGRKLLLIIGTSLAIPASLLAAWAPSEEVLFLARVLGGFSAGMAFPTTLSLITALWSGPARTRGIALWSGVGGAMAALGPVLAGLFLEYWWWGSVFLMTLPLAVVALVLAFLLVPAHVNETSDRVDHVGGVVSVVVVGAIILGINLITAPDAQTAAVILLGLGVVGIAVFVLIQRRVRSPLYDLHVAGRRVFWVAAAAGIIVFGSLMGALFVGQQFQQNVLGYSTFESGLTMLPAAFFMILVAPRSAKLINTHGSRTTLLTGYLFAFLAFLTMLLLWNDGSSLWVVILGYSFMGVGVGFAGTPASHSLTGSVPVTRAGMASGTADLQRDLGGAILQSVFGALLTAGYTTAITAAIASAPNASKVSDDTLNELTRSYNGAVAVAEEYPQYSEQIIQAAKESFLKGDRWAYFAGTMAVLLGAAVIFFLFPKKDAEAKLLAGYQAEDTAARAAARDDEPESAAPGSPSRSAGGGSPSRSAGGGSPS